MISVVDKYFSLNRTLLIITGLWPYQKSKFNRFYLFCCFNIIATFIIFQFATFVTSKCTIDHIIKTSSTSFAIICLIIKYNSFRVNGNTIKYLMEQLQYIYDDLTDNNEIIIIEKYGDNAKRYTSVFTMCLLCSICVIIGAQLWPHFIDIILFANESRSHHLQIPAEYFINQEKYYYVLLLYINIAICLGLIVLVATGAMLIAYLQHACGMFKIARFSEYLISKFEISFMFLIAFGVITLSLNIFRILSTYNIEELPITVVTTCICLIYMFISNLIGQEIIDHYNLIFTTTYEIQWYITPLCMQKLIVFLLLRGNKSFGLNVGGLFISSLECFATLTNASLSYFIVMYSIQQ